MKSDGSITYIHADSDFEKSSCIGKGHIEVCLAYQMNAQGQPILK